MAGGLVIVMENMEYFLEVSRKLYELNSLAYVKIDEDQKSKTLKKDPVSELSQLDTVIWTEEAGIQI